MPSTSDTTVALQKSISLSQYVKKRTGVALGGSGSLSNMLHRSLGATSFARFWHYWNPIWSYYLSRNVMRPLSRFLPVWLAILTTFGVSGGIHDLAVFLVKWKPTFFFTPWFIIMGMMVVLCSRFTISYASFPWAVRMLFNLLFIGIALLITLGLEIFYT